MIKRLAIGTALLLAACGSADVSVGVAPTEVVVTVESSGGCAQMGPNCTRLVVFGDGTVEAYRFVADDVDPIGTGTIDPGLVVDLAAVVAATDFDALRSRLPEGECRGCYDGIDTTMSFETNGGSERFDSIEVELDASEPLFAAAWAVAGAADSAVEVPLLSR